ncbi:UbiD family decarboxylase [Alkalicoccus urumqiensis]|uniref:3-octaprenyl-4-hydroxybenzoate carboxy-lyase n=1 Tax=Alkalicoccus urumqiensis TaxID=1548213 RepID=A0A2P6MDD3_ALKUR|nr:UbiD family decarboxylase [Alkalicoccus urumqiensis]PRO64282.1 3-octaprenyl-4-hydroxybenzoate carboxy-lyase [Alkalicoccus urumqiensis]
MYTSLREAIADLEAAGHLVRVTEEVDPYLEMAAIQLRAYEQEAPAILFENVKGSSMPAVANLFGTMERSRFLFRDTLERVERVMELRENPPKALQAPWKYTGAAAAATNALPLKRLKTSPVGLKEIKLSDLPQIQSWPMDGGAFITLPQVFSEDPDRPGVMKGNLGMYRVQISGNEFVQDEEVGMHYQIHRGIGVHHTKAAEKGEPLRVSIFIGGPPAHTLSAVMPLPEGMSELTFAGLLAGRRFRWSRDEEGSVISNDADVVITGDIYPGETKPEGPFGDHLGYYSLTHEFPLMRVRKVYAREDAVWPFTVVGRPPQEDTTFGEMIHELTGGAVKQEIPGVEEVHAVDASGVHPLLFAVGKERYTPYQKTKRPAELLTIANRILGTGQLSLAKYMFITGGENVPSAQDEQAFLQYVLERVDFTRDLHFQTNTTIDTLDYTGGTLNEGSKVVIAAYGDRKRELTEEVPKALAEAAVVRKAHMVLPGICAIEPAEGVQMEEVQKALEEAGGFDSLPLLIVCDDAAFTAASMENFLWTTFTRSSPAEDTHGLNETIRDKHWGCTTLLIDARRKPHHAPMLEKDPEVEKAIERLLVPGASLHGILA